MDCQIFTWQVEAGEVVGDPVPCDKQATLKHKNIWMCDEHYDAIHPDGECDCEIVSDLKDARVFEDSK